MNQAGAYFVVNGEHVELSYSNANLPYARATTAGTEAEPARIEANVWLGGQYKPDEKRKVATTVKPAAWAMRALDWCDGCRGKGICMAVQ